MIIIITINNNIIISIYLFFARASQRFCPTTRPHLRAGKGFQLSVTWNDKVKSKEKGWVVQNGWNTVVNYCASTQMHSMGKIGTKKHTDISPTFHADCPCLQWRFSSSFHGAPQLGELPIISDNYIYIYVPIKYGRSQSTNLAIPLANEPMNHTDPNTVSCLASETYAG